jgi:hypothetical protein
MALTRRGILAGAATGLLAAPLSVRAAETAGAASRLTEDQLGELIRALTLKPDKQQQRYDFAFTAVLEGDQKWELSMSAVLSQDAESIWIMAWLDECPKSAADVPRTALLRLLAENDKLGSGKFFAYIPSNRRFVLQRVVPNEDMTSAKFKLILQDLGTTVVETHPTWAVAGWSQTAPPSGPGGEAMEATASDAARPAAAATKSATNDSKFQTPIKK